MKPGDIVRFRDVSSGASEGKGFWKQFDGMLCMVIQLPRSTSDCGMIKILLGNEMGRFSQQYLEEIK